MYVCMYKKDLALNYLQRLIYDKTKPNLTFLLFSCGILSVLTEIATACKQVIYFFSYLYGWYFPHHRQTFYRSIVAGDGSFEGYLF